MSKWIAEFELEDGDTMPEHMDLEYKGVKIDFHCRPLSSSEKLNKSEIPTGSDDCISRFGVTEIINSEYDIDKMLDRVDELPPAKPIRPKGHWIKEKSTYGWDGHSYQCSVCGRSIHIDTAVEDLADYPYCHCGANMREVEE